MNVYTVPTQLHTIPHAERMIALGVFDGIHIGHRTVLSQAMMDHALSPAVFTFCNMYTKTGGSLQTDEQRRDMLDVLGFTDVFEADFTAIKDMQPDAFVDMLVRELGAKAIVCGFNFHFGKGGAGDTALLKTLCDRHGIDLFVMPAVEVDGQAVSSTRIKQALQIGDMQTLLRLQSRPFSITATVADGQKLGRTIGSPTINQPLPDGIALPRFGVYASLAVVDGCAHPAVTNIGVRPTVGSDKPLAETYILDFEQDIYGKEVKTEFVRFLRPEQTFASVEALTAQIQEDIAAAKRVFQPQGKVRAILFDFDDTLQDRDAAMCGFVRFWLRREFPDMTDETVEHCLSRMIKAGQHGFAPYTAMLREAESLFPDCSFDEQEFLRLLSIEFPKNTAVLPDAVETLQKLREKGYRLGVLTNGYSHIQNRKLDVAGLRPYLDYVMISGDDALQKPAPEAFRRAAFRLGVHPTDCVYVGDNPENDVQGARGVGMQPVFRDIGFATAEDSVPHIHDLIELVNMY